MEEDTNKRNKNDFVLWFTKSKFEDQALKWDSPWGVGYPGWHIECSGTVSYTHLDVYKRQHVEAAGQERQAARVCRGQARQRLCRRF